MADLVIVGAWLTVAVAALSLGSTFAGWTRPWLTVPLQGMVPWMALMLTVIAAVAAGTGRWTMAVMAALVVGAFTTTAVPLVRSSEPPSWAASSPAITVVETNVLFSNRRHYEVLSVLRSTNADVLVLAEVSRAWVQSLDAAGLLDLYPFHILAPSERGGDGAAILSKLPFADTDRVPMGQRSLETVALRVGAVRLRLGLVHTQAPSRPRLKPRWMADHAYLVQFATSADPVALVGDFNSTYWHPPFRALLALGFTDAHAERGRGMTMSWPVRPFSAMRLDHALYSPGLAATSMTNIDLPGSDHNGFAVTFAVRQS